MFNFLKWILIVVVVISVFFLTVLDSDAKIETLSPGVIAIDGPLYDGGFFEFYKATMDERVKHYRLVIHTPGGSAVSCVAIMNRIIELKSRGVRFTTEAYGLSASAGSYIFMMGDVRILHRGSMLMWHTIEGQIIAAGDEHRVTAEQWILIRNLDNYVRWAFKRATRMSDKSVKYWLDGGGVQWMSAMTAFNVGIATVLIGEQDGQV